MYNKASIITLPGDGIGPEVMAQGVRLLEALQEPLGFEFTFEQHPVGGACLRQHGKPLLDSTLKRCHEADAVLLGAVGDPDFDEEPMHRRPERALLELRASLGAYCNLRPIRIYDALTHASTLKSDVVQNIDLLVVRELTGSIYFGKPAGVEGNGANRRAVNTMSYSDFEIRRIAHKAFQFARLRRCKLTSVDKGNVLAVSQLWREVVNEVSEEYADVRVEHMLVDNCAMQLIREPRQFDVIVTENMFGDILSDEASMLTGSIGMLPSASIGDGTPLFEPVHGAAPDIAGKEIANPIAMIMSIAMMLQYTFRRPLAASAIEDAVSTILARGLHTPDINLPGGTQVGTHEIGTEIVNEALHSFCTTYMTV